MKQDYYRLLNIAPAATPADIKYAAQNQLNQLKKIYTVLSDPDQRAAYDNNLPLQSGAELDNYYRMLGVSPTASVDAIKVATQQQIQHVKQAIAVLSDTEKRRAYDAQLQHPDKTPSDTEQIIPLKSKPQASAQTPVAQAKPQNLDTKVDSVKKSSYQEDFDPEQSGDPIATQTEWTLNGNGYTSFCTHKLVMQGTRRCIFRSTWEYTGVWLFFLVMGIVGLSAVPARIKTLLK